MQLFFRGGKWVTADALRAKTPTEPVIEPTTEAVNDSIEQLRDKYKEKMGNDVPVNKKNDKQWIISKL